MTAGQIAAEALAAGLAEVEVRRAATGSSASTAAGGGAAVERGRRPRRAPRRRPPLLWQVDLLWRRHVIDYMLLRALRP